MSTSAKFSRGWRSVSPLSVSLLSAAFLLVAFCAGTIHAADPAEPLAGSLKFVPATASAYSVSLRNRELFEAVVKSKAWKKLREMPLVNKAWDALNAEPEFTSALDQLKQILADEQNKDLLALLGEMVGDEVFVYSDEQWPKMASLSMQIQTAMRYGPMFSQLTGGDPQLAQMRGLLDALDAHRDELKVPHMVIGFKVRDKQRAEKQLKRLNAFAESLRDLDEVINVLKGPSIRDMIKTKNIGDTKFLTLNLSGEMIPWDNVPISDYEDNPGQYDKLVAKLKEMKLVIGIGLRDDYILLSIGESLEPMAKFGTGPKLAERPEFKQLAPFAKQRVNGITYVSKEFRTALERGSDQIAYLKTELTRLLETAPLPDDAMKRIQKDLAALATDLNQSLPVLGAELMVSYYTARGIEGFSYDWSERAATDSAKPLSLLQHVGAAPLAFSVSRHKPSTAAYDMLVKWLKVGHGYFEDFALPLIGNDERAKYDKFMKFFSPLMSRVDFTTRTKLFPAIADGQFAFVLDAQITSKQWFKLLPPTKDALPMFEPALAWGVSDAELLKQAMVEYRDALNDFFSSFNLEDNPLALVRVPDPELTELKTGTLYSYKFLELAGLDKQITPNGGLSKDVAVLSISPKQTERMLTATPLAVPGLLEDSKRPLAGAAYFNIAATIDALTPWIDRGVRTFNLFGSVADEGVGPKVALAHPDDPAEVKEVLDQVHTMLDVLKVVRTYASVTYQENGVWVTHHELVIQDVP